MSKLSNFWHHYTGDIFPRGRRVRYDLLVDNRRYSLQGAVLYGWARNVSLDYIYSLNKPTRPLILLSDIIHKCASSRSIAICGIYMTVQSTPGIVNSKPNRVIKHGVTRTHFLTWRELLHCKFIQSCDIQPVRRMFADKFSLPLQKTASSARLFSSNPDGLLSMCKEKRIIAWLCARPTPLIYLSSSR